MGCLCFFSPSFPPEVLLSSTFAALRPLDCNDNDVADDKVSPCCLTRLPLLRLQVIYALNTKNDEHEEELESLKEAHEDEVRPPNGAASKKEKVTLYWK